MTRREIFRLAGGGVAAKHLPALRAAAAEPDLRFFTREEYPLAEEERFFVELKRRTVHAYYTSRIGIHDDMQYEGNVLLQEFAGSMCHARTNHGALASRAST